MLHDRLPLQRIAFIKILAMLFLACTPLMMQAGMVSTGSYEQLGARGLLGKGHDAAGCGASSCKQPCLVAPHFTARQRPNSRIKRSAACDHC